MVCRRLCAWEQAMSEMENWLMEGRAKIDLLKNPPDHMSPEDRWARSTESRGQVRQTNRVPRTGKTNQLGVGETNQLGVGEPGLLILGTGEPTDQLNSGDRWDRPIRWVGQLTESWIQVSQNNSFPTTGEPDYMNHEDRRVRPHEGEPDHVSP
jgi:hypothetical protein